MFQSKKANFAISLILAMILWVYVVGELNPETRKVFRNIPITVMNEQVLANDGLAVVSTSDQTMSITLTGKRSQINRINSYDIIASIDVSDAAEGDNQIRINIRVPNNVYIEDQSISRVTVKVEGRTEEAKPVSVIYNGNVSGELEATTVSVDPEEVQVAGAASQVEKVVSVQAQVDVEDISESESSIKANLVPVNRKGNEVQNVTLSQNTATVTSALYYTRTVSLDVPVTGKNAGDYTRTVSAPKSIMIKGSQENVMATTSVTAETIDVSDVTSDTSIEIVPILPEGLKAAGSSAGLTLQVRVTPKKSAEDEEKDKEKEKEQDTEEESEDTTKKEDTQEQESEQDEEQEQTGSQKFSISGSSVSLQNVPEGLSASVNTDSVTVSVTGPASSLEAISEDSISLSADLSGLEAGTHKVAVTVSCDGEYSDITASPGQIEVVLE